MDNLSIAAAAGMRSRMESLDLLAHNLANATTPGFKADRELYRQYFSEETVGDENAPMLPTLESHQTDFTQGSITNTGNPLDLALSGKGFFVAKGPSGPVYLRAGSFHSTGDGRILTKEGYEVEIRTPDGQPFRIDPRSDLLVGKDGTITQGGVAAGRFAVVDFATGTFEKKAGNYFSFSTPQPIDAQNVEVHQGAVEQSNANAPELAVRLVSVMCQFEMLNRALTLGGEMNRKAVEDVARVSA